MCEGSTLLLSKSKKIERIGPIRTLGSIQVIDFECNSSHISNLHRNLRQKHQFALKNSREKLLGKINSASAASRDLYLLMIIVHFGKYDSMGGSIRFHSR